MAHGDTIDSGRVAGNNYYVRHKLLDAAAGTTDGVWIDVRGFTRLSVHIDMGVGTVQIRGSNAPAKPANGVHEIQIDADITTDKLLDVNVPLSWIKAMVSQHTSGTHSVYLIAQV
jgi:hypothetical protein